MHFKRENDKRACRHPVMLACLLYACSMLVLASPDGEVDGLGMAENDAPVKSLSGSCDLSPTELLIARRLLENPRQERPVLECDPELMEFAEMRARDMAAHDYVSHVPPKGVGPNEMLRDLGYDLPGYYVGGRANTIESIIGGESDPERAWDMLLESQSHRDHLLGKGEVFHRQSRFGIAHVVNPNSAHRDYWVIVIVEPRDPDARPMTCTPPPSVCIVH